MLRRRLSGGGDGSFSRRDLAALILPLIAEQFLAVLVGMADTAMVSVVGDSAVAAVSTVDTLNLLFIQLFSAMGKEFARLYDGAGVNKILTIEASGIGIACIAAQEFGCPVVFAKKNKTKNIAGDVWTSQVESYTHGRVYDIIVSKDFLGKGDRVLIIDDFLAMGSALKGLIQLVRESGATLVGAGIAIEKAFQPGGELIRSQGIRVESLAKIASMDAETGELVFED